MTCLTYVFRAYPTKAQVATLELQLSEAARLYNAALQERRDAWRMRRKNVSFYAQDRQLREIRAAGDLAIPNFSVARDVLRRVDRAFAAFFRRVKARDPRAGFPRFRSHRRYDSITFPQYGHGVRLQESGRLFAHGVGVLKFKVHRPIVGAIKTASIKRDAGRWFVLFSVAIEPVTLEPSHRSVGIDVGLADFATTSTGVAVPNPRHAREAAKRLRVAQRHLSRCRKGSKRRGRAVQRVHRCHVEVARQRADFHHKTAHEIVRDHGFIAVENLNVKGLARTRLARSIHDAGWSLFLEKLTYKAANAGRTLVKVDPRRTSQECPCGAPVPKPLSERWHTCQACGLSVPRDHAAALNILARGQRVRALSAARAVLVRAVDTPTCHE